MPRKERGKPKRVCAQSQDDENDADLLGMPLRVTVSPRNLGNGQLEVKGRTEKESRLIALEGAVEVISGQLSAVSSQ